MNNTYTRDYLLLEGERLRDFQEMIHGTRPTAHRITPMQAPITGYTPAGLVRRFFGFFI